MATFVDEQGEHVVVDVELTLHESADVLGVHYMTVYRYVRLGLLHADKVKGTWRVTQRDLRAFQQSTAATVVAEHTGRRRAPWAERIEARLTAGDASGCWGVIEAALASGAKLDDIYLEVLTPALRSITAKRDLGEIDISVEHRASVIVMRLIGRLGPRFTRRGRTRGAVVVGAPNGEMYGLHLAMLADILRQHGWEVSDLGANVPVEGFEYMARTTDGLVALGLFVGSDTHLDTVTEVIARLGAVTPSTPVLIGGDAIRDREHARSLGADDHAVDARAFVALLDALHVDADQPASTERTPVR